MNEQEQKILAKSLEIYLRYGIKSVTMDDISRELGMSKKTVYQHFENKDDLVFKTMQYYVHTERECVTDITSKSDNAIDEMFSICNFFAHMLRERNPSIMMDLQKYHPESWELFVNHKHEFALNNIIENIKAGREQGLYRADFNIDIIARLYVSRLEVIIDNKLFPFTQFPLATVVKEMLAYHIRGIASEKGMKQLELLKDKIKEHD